MGIDVVKIGGSTLVKNKEVLFKFIKKGFKKNNVILVHGGGPEINSWLEKFALAPKFVDGLRYTDEKTLEVVCMVLAGKVNKELTAFFNLRGMPAAGMSASDGKIAVCARIKKLGYVGEPKKIDSKLLLSVIAQGFLPIISSIGLGEDGHLLNINADVLAMSLACDLKSEKLIFVTDVEGVLDNEKKLLTKIDPKNANKWLRDGTITGGMIPKVKSSLFAIRKGVREVVITNLKSAGTVIRG